MLPEYQIEKLGRFLGRSFRDRVCRTELFETMVRNAGVPSHCVRHQHNINLNYVATQTNFGEVIAINAASHPLGGKRDPFIPHWQFA